MSENYYPQIIVAAVDILGMGTLLSRNDQSVSASDTLETFLMNASYSYAHIERSFESDAKPVFHEGFNFGDSMYFLEIQRKRCKNRQTGYLENVPCSSAGVFTFM